jgi:hypothetical protein
MLNCYRYAGCGRLKCVRTLFYGLLALRQSSSFLARSFEHVACLTLLLCSRCGAAVCARLAQQL